MSDSPSSEPLSSFEKALFSEYSWDDVIDQVKTHIFHIETPGSSGTGFMIVSAADRSLCGIATAGHVVEYADRWHQPIQVTHYSSGRQVLLQPDTRGVFNHEALDVAAIAFDPKGIPIPAIALELSTKDKYLRVGNEVGWLGFPSVAPQELCFFSGRISAFLDSQGAYLVDGVAINGVSGGPAFTKNVDQTVTVIGVLTAYLPNVASGEILPGLSLATTVSEYYDVITSFDSVEDAREAGEEAGLRGSEV